LDEIKKREKKRRYQRENVALPFSFFTFIWMPFNTRYLGLKLLNVFSIGCIGSGQMFLPIFYKKVLGLGNDKIGFIFSISKCKKIRVYFVTKQYLSTFYILSCFPLLDFARR
jgi:hypothetical protein